MYIGDRVLAAMRCSLVGIDSIQSLLLPILLYRCFSIDSYISHHLEGRDKFSFLLH